MKNRFKLTFLLTALLVLGAIPDSWSQVAKTDVSHSSPSTLTRSFINRWQIYQDYWLDKPDSFLLKTPDNVLFNDSIYVRNNKGEVSKNNLFRVGSLNDGTFYKGIDWRYLPWQKGQNVKYLVDSVAFCFKYKQNKPSTDTLFIMIDPSYDNWEFPNSITKPTGGSYEPRRTSFYLLLDSTDQTDDFYSSTLESYQCYSLKLPKQEAIDSTSLWFSLRYTPGYSYSTQDTASLDSTYKGGENVNQFVPLLTYHKPHHTPANFYGLTGELEVFNKSYHKLTPAIYSGPDSFPEMHLFGGFYFSEIIGINKISSNQRSFSIQSFQEYTLLTNRGTREYSFALVDMQGKCIRKASVLPDKSYRLKHQDFKPGIYVIRMDDGASIKIVVSE